MKFSLNNIKFFRNILSNFVIFLMILSVFGATYGQAVTIGASTNSYEAIYRGNPNNPNASLMINVYWGTEYVMPMLEVMEEEGVLATFFVGGTWASKNPDLLNVIIQKGHEIGNHGYYHKDHDRISRQRNYEEINITHKLIEELTGYNMNLFAPPSGAFDSTTLEVAEELGYKTIMWTKDTIDWRDKDANICLNRATKNISNGDLILMHPTAHTLQALPGIINAYQQAEINLTTVSNTIA